MCTRGVLVAHCWQAVASIPLSWPSSTLCTCRAVDRTVSGYLLLCILRAPQRQHPTPSAHSGAARPHAQIPGAEIGPSPPTVSNCSATSPSPSRKGVCAISRQLKLMPASKLCGCAPAGWQQPAWQRVCTATAAPGLPCTEPEAQPPPAVPQLRKQPPPSCCASSASSGAATHPSLPAHQSADQASRPHAHRRPLGPPRCRLFAGCRRAPVSSASLHYTCTWP